MKLLPKEMPSLVGPYLTDTYHVPVDQSAFEFSLTCFLRACAKSVRCSQYSDVICCVTAWSTQSRLGSNHGRLQTPTTRWTFTKLHRGFERNRVGNILVMSVQQCLACNAVVSRTFLEHRFILFSLYNFSLSTDFKYMCFCLSVENCQLDGALQLCSSRKPTDIASNFLFTSFDFTSKQQIEFIIQVSCAAGNKFLVCWQDIDFATETAGLTSTDSWILGNVIYAVFTD